MREKFVGIVTDITPHNDRHDIITLYTRTRGRVTFLSPRGSSRTAKMKQSRLLPLSVIEGEMNFKPTSELQHLGSVVPYHVWTDIYFNPVKQMMALFLSEFLNKLLRASMPDENMWDFIYGSLEYFDVMRKGVADFHIAFMTSLLPFTGIQPDIENYVDGYCFDMQGGSFTLLPTPHHDVLNPDEARFAEKLCRVNFSNVKALKLNGALRHRILEGLLRYYGIHFPGTSSLKSLKVIHEIFNA